MQCANRVATSPNDRGSYAWMWIAAGLILAIAVLSTVLRIETLHSDPTVTGGGTDVFGGAGAAGMGADQSAAMELAAISSFWIWPQYLSSRSLSAWGSAIAMGSPDGKAKLHSN